MSDHIGIDNALTVPQGKLWFLQQSVNSAGYSDTSDKQSVIAELGGVSVRFNDGAVFSGGTKIYRGAGYAINIIEYDLDAQTISLNTNDIKLDNKMQLFPNPTNSRLSLNSEKDYNIEVFDLNGRKIMEAQGNNLDMSNLSKATYIVKTFDKASKETYSYKVIKN
tara:strand:- start:529 stop:1023 length:495 start_codon:yes stop_codon:yes gene_type:complete